MSCEVAVPYSVREKWFFHFPVNDEGMPTSDAAHELIRHLFYNRHLAHSVRKIADALVLNPELVRCMCRQLERIDLVFQDPPGSGCYRYRLASTNVELQGRIEASLVDT
ncbi:MAG TPA: hypothetical protein PLF81_14570 [Candidatus Anammoximicrobium sp.]|nr:hypothetical protein [Candidatus Anammoximicrobium sp.]